MSLSIKTKNKYLLAIGAGIFSVLFVGFYFSVIHGTHHEALATSIPDENLRQCIIDNYNSLGSSLYSSIEEIDLNEIKKLYCNNKNIYNLDGIDSLSNLEFLDIRNNYISSLAPVVGLGKLNNFWISGNLLNVSPLRSFDENSLTILKNLHQKNVFVDGADNQILDYDQNLVDGKPQIHVLFVNVVDIDSDVVNNGVNINYKHALTETEKEYFDVIRLQFEQVVEKLSNYRFDIITDVYYTTKTYSYTKWEYGDNLYWLQAEDIDEIEDIRQNYDTVVVNAIYGDEVPRDCGGLGGLGKAMIYYEEKDDDYYNEKITNMDNNRIDRDIIGRLVHEFVHSVEYYGYHTNQNIWEWHAAAAHYHSLFDSEYGFFDPAQLNSESLYMQGAINPNGSGQTGFTDAIIYLPYSRLLKNKDKEVVPSVDSLSLLVGEEEQLYAVGLANVDGQRSFDIIEWSSINQDVATIDSDGLVTAVGVGKTDIIAKVKDNDSFATIEVEVNEILSFSNKEVIKTYGDVNFTNIATTISDGTVTYSSNNIGVAEVNSTTGEVTIKAAGEVTITATVAATDNYNSASASYTLTINKADRTVSFENTQVTKTYGDANFTNTATTTGDGTIAYESSNTDIAEIDANSGEVTIKAAGEVTITATVAATDNYNSASASYTLTINKADRTVSFENTQVTKTYGDANFTNTATTTGDGSITYSSNNTSVAEVDSTTGEVTIKKAGEVTITATVAATDNYNSASASYNLTVNKKESTTPDEISEIKHGYITDELSTITFITKGLTWDDYTIKIKEGENKYSVKYTENADIANYTTESFEITVIGKHRIYETIEGDKQTYELDSDEYIVFKFNIEYSLFEGSGKVYIDEELLNKANYTSEAGSTIVKITNEFIETLPIGEHTISIILTNGGIATASFTTKEPIVAPNTGWISNEDKNAHQFSITLISSAMALPCLFIALVIKKIAKKKS